jgi:4-aminobutyrate aminotransferase-like enzyme
MEKLKLRTIPGPNSVELLKLADQCEPECSKDQTPIVWDHGEGVWIWDVDDNKYIDFTSGVLVSNIGQSHPRMVEAIQRQITRLGNPYSFRTPERIQASSRLVKTFPPHLDKVFLLSTGADATEAAMRIARRYTGKQEILAFHGAFHGKTYGAIGVAGSIQTRRGFGQPVPGTIMAPYAYCYRCFYGKKFPDCDFYCLKMLDRIIDRTSSGDLGSVIVEPYQGAAGFVIPPEGWLKRLEGWAKDRELILIVDEVQSSFGRTGKMYMIEWEDVRPQLLCLGKGMGNSIPASAVAAETKIFEVMGAGGLSSTWGGNPVASAATLAVLDVMESENLPEKAREMGIYAMQRFMTLKEEYKFLGDVRGKGLVIGLEFVGQDDGYTPSPEITKQVVEKCAERGLLLGKVGLYGNVVRVAPPLIIKKEEMDLALDIFDTVFEEIA